MAKNFRQIIESKYNMPFDEVINELHWNRGISIHKIAKETGVSHTAILRLCRLTSLNVRKHSEASRLSISRLNENGLINREKQAKTKQNTFVRKILKQEKDFAKFLDEINIKYEMQKPIGSYNIDFFIEEKNLCVEIDSSYKWGLKRIENARFKDTFLEKQGFKVLRINKVFLPKFLEALKLLK